jgi:hypothetical protein
MIGAGAATVGGVAFTRTRRAKLYRELSGRVAAITSTHALDMGAAQRRALPSFDKRLAVLPDFLPPHTLAALRAEAERLSDPERNYVPTHKKGGTIAYETLIQTAPGIVSLYHASDLLGLVSRLVGVWVGPTPIHDQSSLSLLVYNKPGDHIGWHEPRCVASPPRRQGGRDQHGPEHPRDLRRRPGAARRHADPRRRAPGDTEHDLLQRPPRPLVAGGGAPREGHRILRRAGAVDLMLGFHSSPLKASSCLNHQLAPILG